MLRFLLAVVPFMLIAGVLPAAPIPRDAGKPPFYFPTRVGTKWTYVDKDGTEHDEVVTDSEEKHGRHLVTVKVTSPAGKGNAFTYWRYEVSRECLWLLATRLPTPGSEAADQKPRWLLKLSPYAGDKWGAGETRVMDGVEKVTVPAGTFEAVRVSVNEGSTVWYAPGVGRIRSKNQTFDRQMKSFTLPKD